MKTRAVVLRWTVVIVFVAGITGCTRLFNNRSGCTEEDFWNTMTAATLPASAQIQQEWCTSSFNPTYNVIFTMSPGDLQTFQQSTPVTTWETNAANAVSLADDAAGMSSLLFGHFGDGAIDVEILIDTSNPELYTVYYQEVFVD